MFLRGVGFFFENAGERCLSYSLSTSGTVRCPPFDNIERREPQAAHLQPSHIHFYHQAITPAWGSTRLEPLPLGSRGQFYRQTDALNCLWIPQPYRREVWTKPRAVLAASPRMSFRCL